MTAHPLMSAAVERRRHLAIPQHVVAQRMGVDHSQMCVWEQGRAVPRFGSFVAYCGHVGLVVAVLHEWRVVATGMDVWRDWGELRHLAGLSVRQVADRLGVQPSAVRRSEKGVYVPSLATADRYVSALGMRLVTIPAEAAGR